VESLNAEEDTVGDDEIINESHLNDCEDKKVEDAEVLLMSLPMLMKIQSKTMKLRMMAMKPQSKAMKLQSKMMKL